MNKYATSQDMIIDTVSVNHDVNEYVRLLKVDGSLVLVALPAGPLEVSVFNVVMGRRSVGGSIIVGIAETQ